MLLLMKKILGFIVLILCFSSPSYSEEYKMPNIQPKDLVNDGYILHSITPISDEGPRVMLYTFTKNETKKKAPIGATLQKTSKCRKRLVKNSRFI